MANVRSAGIIGLGTCIPDRVLNNFDIEKMVDTSDEWIRKRTGISERRIMEEGQAAYELGFAAAVNALEQSGTAAQELDLIIVTTETPDYLTPSMACMIQRELGASNAAAFDLNAACSGFVYGLSVSQQFLYTGYYRKILLIGCEGLSRVVDWKDRNTCVLFGDGAGAAVIAPVEDGYGIRSTWLGSDGRLGHNITIPCCHLPDEEKKKRPQDKGRTIWMDGGEVFKFAVRIMAEATLKVVEKSGLKMDNIKLLVPHQANIRIIDGAAKRLGLSSDRVYSNVDRYGNISSASIPVALCEAAAENIISYGDNIVLVGFGGGLTWAAALIRWNRR